MKAKLAGAKVDAILNMAGKLSNIEGGKSHDFPY